ncbi:MAG: hypothetical protein IPK86_02360 [Neisseriales bacterium]|nr:MAG: hypothetical protein IPK86_02360 [Neisseriales bacterium]
MGLLGLLGAGAAAFMMMNDTDEEGEEIEDETLPLPEDKTKVSNNMTLSDELVALLKLFYRMEQKTVTKKTTVTNQLSHHQLHPFLLLAMNGDGPLVMGSQSARYLKSEKPLLPPLRVDYHPSTRQRYNWLPYQAWHNNQPEIDEPPEIITFTPNQPVEVYDGNLYDLQNQDSDYQQWIIGLDYDFTSQIKLNCSLGYLASHSIYHLTNDKREDKKRKTFTAGIDLMIRF